MELFSCLKKVIGSIEQKTNRKSNRTKMTDDDDDGRGNKENKRS